MLLYFRIGRSKCHFCVLLCGLEITVMTGKPLSDYIFSVTWSFPPKGKQAESLIQWSKPPWSECGSWGSTMHGWGDGYQMEELLGGTPAWWEGSFPRWKVGNTEDLQTWLEKSPSSWMRRFSDSFTAALPTENKSYQITPELLPALPAEKSPLYEIALIKTDCLREKMWLTLCSLFDGGQLERDQNLRLPSQYLSYLKESHIDEHLFCDFCYLGCETGWVA